MSSRSMTHSKPQVSKRRVQLVGKFVVDAAIGDEDAELALVGRWCGSGPPPAWFRAPARHGPAALQ